MKQKQIIIISICSFILLAFISGFLFFKTWKNTSNKTNNTQNGVDIEEPVDDEIENLINEDENFTEEEKEELSKEEKEGIIYGEELGDKNSVLTLGDVNNKEYSKELSNVLYKDLITLAQRASYVDIISKIDELKERYKFTEDYNWKICNIYLDANVMVNIKNNDVDGQKGYMVSSLKDPYMLLISTLMLPEKERREVIRETSSLSPMFEGEVTIGETKIYTNENKEEDVQAKIIIDNELSLKELYQIRFSIEGNPLIGYVVKYSNGAIALKTIVSDGEYEHPYKPISYWMNLDNLIYGKQN